MYFPKAKELEEVLEGFNGVLGITNAATRNTFAPEFNELFPQ